jgi:diaminohydroxyphosphoribosylaminopyrimidine deaminase/5-amino-6-(5-phosphoribosylamino)uracil reductase
VLDSKLLITSDHPLVTESQGLATIVCSESASAERESALRAVGADVWRVKSKPDTGLDLHALLDRLAEESCHSVLVEGGRRVAGSIVAAGLVDRVMGFVAPVVLGGGEGNLGATAMAHPPEFMKAALRLHHAEWRVVGCDALLTGWLKDPF